MIKRRAQVIATRGLTFAPFALCSHSSAVLRATLECSEAKPAPRTIGFVRARLSLLTSLAPRNAASGKRQAARRERVARAVLYMLSYI